MLEARRFLAIILALVSLLCLGGLWGARYPYPTPGVAPLVPVPVNEQNRCPTISELQDHITLPNTFQYGFRKIRSRTAETPSTQGSIVRLDQQNLMPELVTFDTETCSTLGNSDPWGHGEDEIIVESFPATAYNVDHSTLLLGVSTSLERLENAMPQLTQWLSGTNASLVVNVADSDGNDGNMSIIQDKMMSLGIQVTLLPNADDAQPNGRRKPDRHGQRHFSIVKQLQRQRGPHHKWFGIIDDDTFFPSLSAVVTALQKYDPEQPHYIGGLSEDLNTMKMEFGYMAYGGAGIFISGPLLDTLLEHFDECVNLENEGDMIYRECVYRYTYPPVQLTVLPGLHQLDFRGDASGWYEAGPHPLLSLHHWNSKWFYLYPIHYGYLISKTCGERCFLQRHRFADDAILTNGYSVAQYPGGVDHLELERVEATFMHDAKDPDQWEFSLGRLRPRLKASEKISWRLEYAVEEQDGRIRQFYIYRAGNAVFDSERLKQNVTGVLELEWIK